MNRILKRSLSSIAAFFVFVIGISPALPSSGKNDNKTALKKKEKRKLSKLLDDLALVEDQLKMILWKYGRDQYNPWLLGHIMLAFGKDIKLPDGTRASDKIFSYARIKKIGDREYPYFPVGAKYIRIDPHPFFQLKTMLEVKIPLDKTFSVQGKKFTLRDLLQAGILSMPSGKSATEEELSNYVWLLYALFNHLPKGKLEWKNGRGETVLLPQLIQTYVKYLDKKTSFLRVLKNRGVKKIPKLKIKKQHIYGEPCGGLHLVQGVMRWLSLPLFKTAYKEFIEAQIELLFYRFDGEMALYDELFKKYQKNMAFSFIILLQQLKFLGHLLETFANLYKWGIFKPTKTQKKKILEALKRGIVIFMILKKLGWYDRVPNLRSQAFQFYLDILGDTSHLLHSIRMFRNYPELIHIYT